MASKKKAMSGIQEAKGVGIVLLLPVGLFGVIWAISAYEDVWPAGAICFVTSLLFVLLVGSSLRTSYGAGSSGNSDDRKPEEEELVQEREDDEEWEDDDVADYERPWFLNKLFLACFLAVLMWSQFFTLVYMRSIHCSGLFRLWALSFFIGEEGDPTNPPRNTP